MRTWLFAPLVGASSNDAVGSAMAAARQARARALGAALRSPAARRLVSGVAILLAIAMAFLA
ncbi:hypothetical protein [Enhydrobacter sp.]|uniref:hypothetical protein n=1 Tax=Enhydrobacter sp. TaxID=1894999 RepID=UPI0026299E16|nr:hypothetical protein [Enhydrobacter sp.]WIM09358.1 MAG: hypothetical protein OJF58_000309 [Enhydrobacter sp.]